MPVSLPRVSRDTCKLSLTSVVETLLGHFGPAEHRELGEGMFSLKGRQAGGWRLPVEYPGGELAPWGCAACPGGWGGQAAPTCLHPRCRMPLLGQRWAQDSCSGMSAEPALC